MRKGYPQNLDNGVIDGPGESVDPSRGGSREGICFHSLINKGENPNGFTAVVPTGGAARDEREGRNKDRSYEPISGERWANNKPWSGNKSGE